MNFSTTDLKEANPKAIIAALKFYATSLVKQKTECKYLVQTDLVDDVHSDDSGRKQLKLTTLYAAF